MPDVAEPTVSPTPSERLVLSDQVALRPERFGALAYHYGTRRLVFLRDRTLVEVVKALADHPSAEAACDAVGVPAARRRSFAEALDGLRAAGVLERAA